MLTSNMLVKQVDLPTWEWLRFAPTASAGTSSSTSAMNESFHAQHGRFVYYHVGTAGQFWRYDTVADGWQLLSQYAVAPAVCTGMKFNGASGPEGIVLAATTNSITIPHYMGQAMTTFDVSIIAGTGAGQRRIITSVSDPIVGDAGTVSAVANTIGGITLTDSTKAWTFNQWAGYQVRIISGTG
jgi:hypothetical protein